MNRTLWWLPRFFAALGAALLLIAAWVYAREQAFVSHASRATGSVVRLELSRGNNGNTWHPVVDFRTSAGQPVEILSNVGSNPPSWHVGDTVSVYYDPANPQSAKMAGFSLHIGSFVLSILGIVFGLVGAIWLWIVSRGENMAAEVRASGQRIQAKVVEVESRTNVRVNGRHPFRIVAQAQLPGSSDLLVFRSANIWFNPAEFVGETVTVFVDRNDPKRYVVDLDFLPKVAN